MLDRIAKRRGLTMRQVIEMPPLDLSLEVLAIVTADRDALDRSRRLGRANVPVFPVAIVGGHDG